MSSIPNNAMPHAGPSTDTEIETGESSATGGAFSQIADKAREYPKTAIAAGATVAAGVVAAAVIGARGRSKPGGGGKQKKKDARD